MATAQRIEASHLIISGVRLIAVPMPSRRRVSVSRIQLFRLDVVGTIHLMTESPPSALRVSRQPIEVQGRSTFRTGTEGKAGLVAVVEP